MKLFALFPLALGPLMVQAVENLGSGHEYRAGAGQEQQFAAPAGILRQVGAAPLDRAESERVDDQERLEASLDHEQAAHLAKHRPLLAEGVIRKCSARGTRSAQMP
jgi:hypothetical protein